MVLQIQLSNGINYIAFTGEWNLDANSISAERDLLKYKSY